MDDDGQAHRRIDERFVPEELGELAFEALDALQRGEPAAAIAQTLMEEHHLGATTVYKLLRAIGLTHEDAESATNEATRPSDDA